MKLNWQTKKLGNICVVGAGNSAPQKKELFKNGKHPFFRTSDIGKVKISKELKEVSDYLNDDGIKQLCLFQKGTILIPKSGVEELAEEKLPNLLKLKYHAIADAEKELGGVDKIRIIFFAFQKNLYSDRKKML